MSDIADKLIDTAYVVDGMLIQRDNLLQPIPTLMRDASIDIHDLEAENAKLREFAAETWELLTCNEPVFVWKGLREKARELGVEVEECTTR